MEPAGETMRRQFFRSAAWRGYLLALVAWGLAFALRFGLAHWFPPGFPYLTFFPAVVLVAYYAGLRPAILTATLSGLAAWWFWIGPPGFDLAVATRVALGFYAFVVTIDIFFIVGMRQPSVGPRGRAQRRLGGEPRYPDAGSAASRLQQPPGGQLALEPGGARRVRSRCAEGPR